MHSEIHTHEPTSGAPDLTHSRIDDRTRVGRSMLGSLVTPASVIRGTERHSIHRISGDRSRIIVVARRATRGVAGIDREIRISVLVHGHERGTRSSAITESRIINVGENGVVVIVDQHVIPTI